MNVRPKGEEEADAGAVSESQSGQIPAAKGRRALNNMEVA